MAWRNNRNNRSNNNQSSQQSQETHFLGTVDEGFALYLEQQTSRVVSAYRGGGYEIVRIGYRQTKNPAVTMWRAYVKCKPSDDKRTQKANAATLVRDTFPGVGEISFYQPDYETLDSVCVVWFGYEKTPFKNR